MNERNDLREGWDRETWKAYVDRLSPNSRIMLREALGWPGGAQASNTQNILSELSVDQIDACDNPQIIQRVKGAKYILCADTNGRPPPPGMIARINEIFMDWWDGDAPLLITHLPARVEVIILPEAAE